MTALKDEFEKRNRNVQEKELKKELQQKKQELAQKDNMIEELKQLLQKNQAVAEELKDKVQRSNRFNFTTKSILKKNLKIIQKYVRVKVNILLLICRACGEVEQKNSKISKLHKKLQTLQNQLNHLNQSTATSIPSPTQSELGEVQVARGSRLLSNDAPVFSHFTRSVRSSKGDDTAESMERVRHPTNASSAPTLSPIQGGISIDSTKDSDILPGVDHTVVSKGLPQSSRDQVDFGKYIRKSEFSQDLDRNTVLGSELGSPPQRQNTLGADSQEDEILPAQVTHTSFTGRNLSFGSTPELDRSQALVEISQMEVDTLKTRLQAVEDLNETLKSELKLFENLNPSEGVQTTPGVGRGGSMPGAGKTKKEKTLSIQEHLEEMRALRRRLEESLAKNDQMMEELGKKKLGRPTGRCFK